MMDLLWYPLCSEGCISNYDLHHFAISFILVLWYLVFVPFFLTDITVSFQWLICCHVKVSGNIRWFSVCRFGFLLHFTYFVALLLNRIFLLDFLLNLLILMHFPYATRKEGWKVLCPCVCVCNCHLLTDKMDRFSCQFLRWKQHLLGL